jgi:hypothetical protein
MSVKTSDAQQRQELQSAGILTKTEQSAWHRPTITRIDMKDTMSGSTGKIHVTIK